MKAVIQEPGIFNLQSLKVTLKDDEDVEEDNGAYGTMAYDFGVQWLINVSSEETK